MNSFDLYGYHLLNQFAGFHPRLDMGMAFVAQYSLEIYIVMFLVAWFSFPKSDSENRHNLIVMGFSGVIALVFNVIISNFWFRPRPFVTLAPETFTQLIPHSIDASFPSDHTSGSFGFAFASWRKPHQLMSWSFTSLAVLVAIARVYVGVHWPTDVIASMIVGMISSRFIWAINAWFKPLTNLGLRLFHYGEFANH